MSPLHLKRSLKSRLKAITSKSPRAENPDQGTSSTQELGEARTVEIRKIATEIHPSNEVASAASISGQYSFQAIPGEGWIRVLDLKPAGDLKADLKATLRFVHLAEGPLYDAISYTWGEPLFTERLTTDGLHLAITENLSNALRHFRSQTDTRTLWADSVCINQQDNVEKAHQVSVMADIYKSACNVLIWLGLESPDTRKAFDYVEDITRRYNVQDVIDQKMDIFWWTALPTFKADFPELDALAIWQRSNDQRFVDIFSRDWFTRLWTVQEVAMACVKFSAVVHCGSFQMKWGKLECAILLLLAAISRLGLELDSIEALKRANTICEVGSHFGNVEAIPMSLIVNAYQNFGKYVELLRTQNCSDARDRVYALLGLRPNFFKVVDSEINGQPTIYNMKPDYNVSALELYRKFTLGMVVSGDFDFLLSAGIWQRRINHLTGGRLFLSGTIKTTKGHWFTRAESDTLKDAAPGSLASIFAQAPPHLDIEAFSLFEVIPGIPSLPSWATDLSNSGREPYTLPWVNELSSSEFRAGGGLSNAGLPGKLNYDEDDLDVSGASDTLRRIRLRGRRLGTMESQVIIHEWESDLPGSRLCYIRSMVMHCRTVLQVAVENAGGEWVAQESPDMTFARTIMSDGSGPMFRSIMKDCFLEGEHVDHEKLLLYWNAYDRYWQGKDLDGLQEYHSFDDLDASGTTPEELEMVKRYHRCLVETLEGHIFFCTKEKGMIGLGPLPSKFEDTLVIILGVRNPLVLRYVTDSTGKSGFLIIGPCYLSGIMDGSQAVAPEGLKGDDLYQSFHSIPLI